MKGVLGSVSFVVILLVAVASGSAAGPQEPNRPAPEHIISRIEKLVRLESVPQGELWDHCVLFLGYDFTTKKAIGSVLLIDDPGAHFPKKAALESLENDKGYLVSFHKDKWGGNSVVRFRNGKIGSCPAIPVFISDDTEALIEGKAYIFHKGKWFTQR